MAPIIVLYLLLQESHLVGRLAWDKTVVGEFLRRGMDDDAKPEARKTHVRRRLILLVGGVMVMSAFAALIVLQRCTSCPCSPLFVHALRYTFFLLGLTFLGYSTPGARGNAFGAACLACGVVASLSSVVSYAGYGIVPFALFVPNLPVDVGLFYVAYHTTVSKTDDGGDGKTCDTACGTPDIFANLNESRM